MRTIKFRGKRLDNGEWVYGDLLHIAGGCLIYFGSDTKTESPDIQSDSKVAVELHKDEIAVVDPTTVGQFTGLLDKNGKEIYEGDVIKSPLGNVVSVRFGYKEHVIAHGRPRFTDSIAAYGWIASNLETGITDFMDNSFLCGEVIGNVHDNTPELLNKK